MIPHTIKNLIDNLGKPLTLKRYTAGTYDPTTQSVTRTSTNETVKGYQANYKLQDLDGDTVVLGDRKVYLSAYNTDYELLEEPVARDAIVDSVGDEAVIVSVQKVYYQNKIACYICQVRE